MPLDRDAEILLVEDDVAQARLLAQIFKLNVTGYQLHVVKDGEEAMDFLLQQGKFKDAPTPDLVLLDLNLPKKDGREVLRESKLQSKLRNIPIIVLTTSSNDTDVVTSYDYYANSFIIKPSGLFELEEVIKSIRDYWLNTVILPNSKANPQSTSIAQQAG